MKNKLIFTDKNISVDSNLLFILKQKKNVKYLINEMLISLFIHTRIYIYVYIYLCICKYDICVLFYFI